MNPADCQIYPDAQVLHQDRYVAAVPPYHNVSDAIAKTPRLKEVCDSCSAAKVRCSRDKDGCNRCLARGIECVYSASRRVGRRRGPRHRKRTTSISSVINCPSSPSTSLVDCTESDASPLMTYLPMPGDSLDKAALDNPYLWSLPPHPEDPTVQFPVDHGLYGMQDYDLNQSFMFPMEPTNTFPGTLSPPEALTPVKTSKSSSVVSEIKEPKLKQREDSTTSSSTSSSMDSSLLPRRSSSSSDLNLSMDPAADSRIHSSHITSVYDELQGLTIFAFSMEQKFDAVVRQQMSCRPASSSDFGLPLEELLSKPDDGSNGKGRNEPGQLESAYYYSLAELRRRLKWLREDVGNMIPQPGGKPADGFAA
ncbi:hypothetical protein M409DRAFT_16194 [Zasmidium cellare ATCC 36951]|uniref:Zn(2)-C6 fungal-type domain-containing protein n=1 Tax=Zasmidium cellare ATCC 36951 TaxID=1080233 RepID=A0A6A6D8F2_ZASCE|nr:uncharacterized protein M409DRAFT_16194 [Zasmidium cellare ATCC 36951]KAF2173926.1 hypothetical protein M409DRAFT_16194 [Zasmidium cellare ATCC 36951]